MGDEEKRPNNGYADNLNLNNRGSAPAQTEAKPPGNTSGNQSSKPNSQNGQSSSGGNFSSTSQNGNESKNQNPEMPDAKNTSNKLNDANKAPDAASGGKATGINAASTAVNAAPNMQQSVNEAANGDLEGDVKELATDTLEVAPRAVIDASSGNVPGLIVDAVDYATRTGPIIIKLLLVTLAALLLIFFSIIGTVGMLPSMMFGGIEEKLEDRQIDKAQNEIESFYEEQTSEIVSNIIGDMKTEADISNFSTWKRIVAGKNDKYAVAVTRVNETDSLVKIDNLQKNVGIQVIFKNIYLNDFSSVCVDKVSLINAFAYKNAFADDESFKQGKVVDNEKLFTSDETTKWRGKDTSALKNWLKDNKDNLVTYTLTETGSVENNGFTYQCFTCDINAIATIDDICSSFGFTDEQKEQMKTLAFAGNVYVSAQDDVSEQNEKILSKNIYPRLDVYTNLVGGSDTLIWSMLPTDYLHLIAENDSTGTAMLIHEILNTANGEIGYTGTAQNNSKYNVFVGTDNVPWSASFIAWVMNEVDGKISMANKLLDNVIPKTTDVNYLAGYLFTNNFTWHYASDNYVPQVGDIIFLYTPKQVINSDGSITLIDAPTVSESYPDLGVSDTNLRVSSAGIVESCSNGIVAFIYGDSSNETVEKTELPLSSELIVGYAMPNYEDVAGETLVYEGDMLEVGDFLLPFRGTATISALYGLYPSGGIHNGLDFACPVGTPVVACNAGTVAKVDATEKTTYGYHVKITSQTSSGSVTCIYAHMSQIYVKAGEEVSAGQVIGLSGNTGNTTGPHIHLTIEQNGVKRNPAMYMRDKGKIKLHAQLTA